jgi:hypothetical protein
MKKSIIVAMLTVLSFQVSYADVIESCRLGKVEIQAEDGRHGGIEVGLVLENGQAIAVSDDIQIKQDSVNEINQIVAQTNLKPVIDSLHLSLENVSSLQTLKIGEDAIVIRFMDENGNVLAKVGQTQIMNGVCESDVQSNSQTP